MLFRKLNNATLWEKINKLRALIKTLDNFKKRTCWNCGYELNIYDFLSSNIEFSPEYLLKLWQTPFIELKCCNCFKDVKLQELERMHNLVPDRTCEYCGKVINIYQYSRYYNYLKINELKSIWFNNNEKVFCNKICLRKYYNIKGATPTRIKIENKK